MEGGKAVNFIEFFLALAVLMVLGILAGAWIDKRKP